MTVLKRVQLALWRMLSPQFAVLLLLLVLVQVSAVAVVYSTYQNRLLFSKLQSLKSQSQEMQVVWRQLLLEQSTLASFNRVVEVADKQLAMTAPDPDQVVVLKH